MKMHCNRLGRPKTVVFFLDRLDNYKSPSKPRCTVHVHLGMAKRKIAKTHVTADYVWETELPVPLPQDVTDETTLTLRVMDNKREVGSTSVQLFYLPYDTPSHTGREAFPSIPHMLEEPFRRNACPAPAGSSGYVLNYSCWIREVDGVPKASRGWKPFKALRKAFSRSNLTKDEGNLDDMRKKNFAQSMFDLTTESALIGVDGMFIRPINLDEPCPPPARASMRQATSLHNLAMAPQEPEFATDEPATTAEQLVAWVHEQVPCPPAMVDGKEVPEPLIRDVEPREVVWGEENVLSIYGEHLGNAGRDIERLTVCGIDVTDSCYSDPPSNEIPYDHIMCHIHGDEDGLPAPKPGDPLRRGFVEIVYKDGRQVKSLQRVSLLPPSPSDSLPAQDSLDLSDDTSAPFDLDNFHPSSGVHEAAQAMLASGQLSAERQCDSRGPHVVVKPRVSSFSGAVCEENGVCHAKNASMPHLGQCEAPADEAKEEKEEEAKEKEEEEEKEEGEEVERRRRSSGRRVHSSLTADAAVKTKARRGSDKSGRGFTLPKFLSRSQLHLSDAGQGGEAGDEEVEEDSTADSAYDTLQRFFRRGPVRGRRKCQSRSSSVTSADLVEENQRLKKENQDLREDIEQLWKTNLEQKGELANLRRKLHELTSAFEKHKAESDLHVNELMNLKLRLLADQRDEYLCID